jgi:C_GCAxxG_C_C family probable redox protein
MKFSEKAKSLYLDGYSCSESVMKAAQEAGLLAKNEELCRAMKVFRAGIMQNRCLCGALASVILILGLQPTEGNDQKVNELYKKFVEKYGGSCCRVVSGKGKTGVEFDDPQRKKYCSEVVLTAAQFLE